MSARWRCPIRGSASLRRLAKSAQIVPTRLTFVDIAGLVRGASKGEGLGNQFLANIREVDAIAHVVRCFEDPDVTHVGEPHRPDRRHRDHRDRADAGRSRQPRAARRRAGEEGQGQRQGREGGAGRRSISSTARSCCCATASPRAWSSASRRRRRPFHMLGLLTSMPVLYVCNVDEASAADRQRRSHARSRRARKQEGAGCVVISAKIEAEIAVLSREERTEYLGGGRPARGRARPPDPRRLCAARSRHLFHRRAEGGARPGRSRAAPRRRRPPA